MFTGNGMSATDLNSCFHAVVVFITAFFINMYAFASLPYFYSVKDTLIIILQSSVLIANDIKPSLLWQ